MKSSKLAGIKYFSGLIIATALIVGFGCDQNSSITEEPIFNRVEEMPEYPGGTMALHKYIAESVKYPVTAQENGIEGRVYVSFVVNSLGEVTKVEIAREVDPALDDEALRVIEEMPKWKPGYQQGMPVSVAFTVPINFALQKKIPISRQDSIKGEPVFFIVEEMPEYPGGEEALHKYIGASVNYPEVAKEKGIEGRVFVTFVIDKNGKAVKVKIARGVDPLLDREALRVVTAMPTWKPGKQRGQNVKVSFTMPVNFTIK